MGKENLTEKEMADFYKKKWEEMKNLPEYAKAMANLKEEMKELKKRIRKNPDREIQDLLAELREEKAKAADNQ